MKLSWAKFPRASRTKDHSTATIRFRREVDFDAQVFSRDSVCDSYSFGEMSTRLKSMIDLLKSKARKALTAGDPRTMAIASAGRLEASNTSSGVVEPAVASTVGVRPKSTDALAKLAFVYSVAAFITQLNILTQYWP